MDMEHESRNSFIVESEEMEERRRGRHCRRGHHILFDEPCEDPRILMYIDDDRCTRRREEREEREEGEEREEHCREESDRHHMEDNLRRKEAENVSPVHGWQQENTESAAQYQNWTPGNTQNAASYQGWQQGNVENSAHNQGQMVGASGQVRSGTQLHVHEVQGTVEIAEPQTEPHNHRFATVSGEARPLGNNDHYHDIRFRTDNYEDHYHEGWGRTGGSIQTGDRHVHFLESMTTQNDGHMHKYRMATMMDNPIGDLCSK